jgi:heme-degrading monooxygenase HmoA
MHARIAIVRMPDEMFEEGIQIVRTQALPSLRVLPGYRAGTVLSDREGGTALVMTFWETREDMKRSESEAAVLREDSAAALGIGDVPVERYEVDVFELGGDA